MSRSGVRQVVVSAVLALGAVGVVFPVGNAVAVDWGPLNSYYNGIERVSGFGSFINEGSARATTVYFLTDSRADGNPVYARTRGAIYEEGVSGDVGWQSVGTYSTNEFYNIYLEPLTTSFGLSSTGSRARGSVDVCAQMGFPVPDSCSEYAFPTFDY